MKKESERVLAQAIQAYVLGYGKRQVQAGFILQQLDGPWSDKKDYILECMVNALNDDDSSSRIYDTETVYSDLMEESIGWDGDDSSVVLMG